MVVKFEDRLKLREYKKSLVFSKFQLEVLIGTILGDATIPKQLGNRSHNIKFEQSIVKKEYVEHLYGIFKDWVGTAPVVRNIKGGGAKDRQSVWFRTYRHESISCIYNIFYVDGVKKVPYKFLEYNFTDVSLAYWFMDDGTRNTSWSYVVSSQSFSFEDNLFLSRLLFYKFNLNVSVHKDGEHFRLYIHADSVERFNEIVSKYFVTCMYYKLHKSD